MELRSQDANDMASELASIISAHLQQQDAVIPFIEASPDFNCQETGAIIPLQTTGLL